VGAGQQQSKDVRMTPYARVSGTVLDDEQRPVAAALIGTEDVSSDPFLSMRFNRTYNPARSGPDGRFTVKVGPERDLRVKATKRGYPEGKSDAMQLAAGERKRGTVLVIPSGIAVTGRITDRDGNPLSGVSVVATEAEPGSGGMMRRMIFIGREAGAEEEPVTTGSDGTFLIRLKEGTYDFAFRREGYSAKAVRAQQVTTGARPIEAALDPSVEIRGRVVRNGNGIEGVQVSSFTLDQQSTAITAADGSFTLADLSAGMVRLMVRKEEEFIQEQRNVNAPGRDVLIEIPPGGTISGRVVDKSSRKPVTAFQAGVSNSRSAGGMMMVMPPSMRSIASEDGTFTLENVPAGAVNLVVAAPGYAQGRKSGLTLEEGKAITDVEVELDTGVKLLGRVTAPDGSALSGVSVREAPVSSRGMVAPTRSEQRVTTESNGDYVLDTLEPGEKTFEFTHPKYLTARKTVELKGREMRVDVRMESGARLTGTVVTDSGAAVAEARVEATGGGRMNFGNSVRSDASGNFAFESLEPGRYTFRASKGGYATGEVEDVEVGATQNIRITLGRGGVIYGRVRGLSEAEYPHTYVEARGSEGTASSAVDATGAYRIEGAPAGSMRVSATVSRDFSARKTSQVQTVQLEAGGSQQVDVEFLSNVEIRGRITRDGRPLTGGTITFYPRNATASTNASAPIDDAGLYSVSGLEPGEYTVLVNDNQRLSPYQTTYRVQGAADFDIDYRTISVRGRVVDSSTSEPIVDARVQLKPSGEGSMMMMRGSVTDSNGNFAIDFVPAGSYSASAEKESYATELRPLQVSESSAPDLDFRLARNDGIRLTVIDARDRRPISAMVRATDAAGQTYDSGFRMDRETITLAVPPGTFRVTVSAVGFASQTLTLTSPSQQTVALSRGGTLVIRSRETTRRRGRLMGANGPHVQPSRMASTWFPIEAGETSVENIQPGRYTLQALGENDVVLDQTEVVIVEGQRISVDF
ncbi:MAG TPA: carboxypeptidase-like regulatory domain-containing protein, partial [Thermoanaerobaculia bacterium]